MKRLVSSLLVISTVISAAGMAITMPAFANNTAKNGLLFSSSFEKDEAHTLLQSTKADFEISNIAPAEYDKKDPSKPMSYIIPSSIDGSPDGFSGEGKINLFDGSTDSKYCIDADRINESSPITVLFSLSQPCLANSYIIASANDGQPRDPKSFKLYGSNDAANYTLIDSRENVSFSGRKQSLSFDISQPALYRHFKLEITSVYGEDRTAKGTLLCQLSELCLVGNIQSGDLSNETLGNSPMASVRSNGPTSSQAANTYCGFTGQSALSVYGRQTGKENTYAANVIFDSLSIKVEKNTRLSYVIYPALFDGSYDYSHTSKHMSIDLLFSDGTRLSQLDCTDQNGIGLHPRLQGDGDVLTTEQWNYVEAEIGEKAYGKTVCAILVYFDMQSTKSPSPFLAYFDDVKLENKSDTVYEHPADYISILRGTNNTKSVSRGITTPLVTLPNGFNAYTPVNTADELLPYYYQEKAEGCELRHITVNHTASPWLPGANWGVWQMMANSSIDINSENIAFDAPSRAAKYSHESEVARAHYYSVTFDEDDKNAPGVKMEITPESHSAYARFTYPEDSENVNLILGTDHSGSVTVTSDPENGVTYVVGYSDYNQKMYVYSRINALYTDCKKSGNTVILSFDKNIKVLEMTLATSYISSAQAEKNHDLEIKTSDSFESVFERAQGAWDEICSLVVPEGASQSQLVTLYSNLYRMYCYPVLYSENTGSAQSPSWSYRSPYSDKIKEGKMYTVNGFWDTFRAEWQAITLLTPNRASELLSGILLHYEDSGYIARWLGRDGEKCMTGTHSDIIFADAYLKGIQFDAEKAFEAMLKNGSTVSNSEIYGRVENDFAIFNGYVPNSYENGLSWTLEDYLNDYGICKMAEALAEKEGDADKKAEYLSIARYYQNRALSYPFMFNDRVGFFMGKSAEGTWTKSESSFDPYALDWYADYAETNAWNMAFPIVYDINGLAALYGGSDKLLQKLDTYFSDSSASPSVLDNYTYEQRETRLGLSMFNNQVCYHIPYIYAYLGQSHKTQEITRDILSRLFTGSEIGQGYPGDEDNGATSAFYVLSAIGLYQCSPASLEYIITSPLYEKVTLNTENGRIVIDAKGNSRENIYIRSCKINGESYDKPYISYEMLASESLHIEYEMSSSAYDMSGSAPTSLSDSVKVPEYLGDITDKNIKIRSLESPLQSSKSCTLYCSNTKNASKLFDNDANSASSVSGSLIFSFDKPSKVGIITLSASNSKPSKKVTMKVEYSADGKSWVDAGAHSLNFKWGKYTLPIALPEADSPYYLLKMSFEGGNITLSEIELLGSSDRDSTLPPISADTVPEAPGKDTEGKDEKKENKGSTATALVLTVLISAIIAVSGIIIFVIIKKRKFKNEVHFV